jgi:hypothetical protein
MSEAVSIKGIDKAALLAALYNHSRPMGMGIMQARRGDMTIEEARQQIDIGDDSKRMFGSRAGRDLYFDYVWGRPLKIDISGDELRTALYNRDNGQGAAERIVEKLRSEVAA